MRWWRKWRVGKRNAAATGQFDADGALVHYHVRILSSDEFEVVVPRSLVDRDGIGSLVYNKIIELLDERDAAGMDSVEVLQLSKTAVVQVLDTTEPGVGIDPQDRDNVFDSEVLDALTPDVSKPVVFTVT